MKRQLGNRASLTLALGLESARNRAGVTKIALATKAHSSPQNIALITGPVSGVVVVDADSTDALNWIRRRLPYTPS